MLFNNDSHAVNSHSSSWQGSIDMALSLKPCIEEKIGKSLICNTVEDINKVKTCNIGGNNDLFMFSFFIAQNAKKTKYITNFKSFLIVGMESQVKTHFTNSTIEEPVGAILFKFDNGKSVYMPSEAPIDEELFINTVWDNNIDTYVTLTNKDDNDPAKIRFLRGVMSTRVDLHHLDRLYDKVLYGFQISKPKIIQSGDIDVMQSEIIHNNKKRIITHIRCNKWEDAKDTGFDTLNNLINIINKYRKNKEQHPLFVNCFAGIGRTRALIMALHAKELSDSKIQIDPLKISDEYFSKNYNANMLQSGEFLKGYRKDCSYDQYLMFEKYCLSLA